MLKITKEELEKLYLTRKNSDICRILGISLPTLLKYIKNSGIKPKGKGNRDNFRKCGKILVVEE